MSIYVERATMSLHKMINEMFYKGIELPRITKCATQLLMTNISVNSIPNFVLDSCLKRQNDDGGWVSVVDTIWNTKLLSFFNKNIQVDNALNYLLKNTVGDLFGRSKRDIERIPVSGLAFYLIPELANHHKLNKLENLWLKEKNGLTYKAAYTLMAFKRNDYRPANEMVIKDIIDWLTSQQEMDGGFAPWKSHPVGSNVYCSAVSLIGLLQYVDVYPSLFHVCKKTYEYIQSTQLKNGLWPYHELDDGGGWGLVSLYQFETRFGI